MRQAPHASLPPSPVTLHSHTIDPPDPQDLDACRRQLAECQRQLDELPERNRAAMRAAIQGLEEAIAKGKLKG